MFGAVLPLRRLFLISANKRPIRRGPIERTRFRLIGDTHGPVLIPITFSDWAKRPPVRFGGPRGQQSTSDEPTHTSTAHGLNSIAQICKLATARARTHVASAMRKKFFGFGEFSQPKCCVVSGARPRYFPGYLYRNKSYDLNNYLKYDPN